jgi:vitamin B12 transporter
MKKASIVLLVVVLQLVGAFPVSSQTQNQEANLSGVLTDPSGGGVGGAKVTARVEEEEKSAGIEANATKKGATKPGAMAEKEWTTESAGDGAYMLNVPAGRYLVVVAKDGFGTRETTVVLVAGETRKFDLRMELAMMSSSVLVTGQATPVSVSEATAPSTIITGEAIAERQAVGLPDLLQYAPGVVFGRTGANGGTASIFLDGGNSNFTKVLIDGTPINPPGGPVDFSILTADNVQKIEIVHGAESAIYGTDAVSGVVQLFTNRGEKRVPAISVFTEGGSLSSVRGGAQLSGVLGRFDYSASGSYLDYGGQVPNNELLNRTMSGNFGYAFSDTNQIRLSVRNNTSDAGIPGQTLFEPPSLHQRINQELFSSNLRWNFSNGGHWQYQLMGAESYTRQHSFNPEQSFYATDPNVFCPQANPGAVATGEFCDFTYDDLFKYNRAGLSGQASYVLPKFAATAGYQYEVENGSLSFLEQPHIRRNNQGGYVDFRYLPVRRVSLNLGARAEDNANFGTRVVPRVGASVSLHDGKGFWGDTRYRVFYGEGIKEPRFDQSYGTDPCDPGNPTLKPESSKTWSTGIDQKLANDRVKLSGEYFSNRFYDVVSFTFCAPGGPCPVTPPPSCPFGYGTYFNTDLARARGTNVTAEIRATRWFLVRGNYTYDDSLVLKSPNAFDPALVPGNRLIRRPPNSGSLTFTGTFRKFSAMFAGYFVGQRTDSDFLGLGYTRNPGYARFDLAGSYRFYRGMSIYARATNLFDKKYQDALGYSALGRDARVGLRYEFGGRN